MPPIPGGSGLTELDAALGGLLPGDNVAWVVQAEDRYDLFEAAFLAAAAERGHACAVVVTDGATASIRSYREAGVRVFDARVGRPCAEPAVLEEQVVRFARENRVACLAVAGLDVLAGRWGQDRAVAFYRRCCPRLFDASAIAYWRISTAGLGQSGVSGVRQVAQCVLELGGAQLRIVKAEGRPRSVAGGLLHLQIVDERPVLSVERALGRLARGLERVRRERSLTQADLARLANVTPSAISQAEAGRRGLSLDTLLILTERLGITIDGLLETTSADGYLLARRPSAPQAITSLFDDPALGLRAYLVCLGPGEEGHPPFKPKASELVAVVSGLIQLDVGKDTPVLRAGDAALAFNDQVRAWRNLIADPAVLFWIVRQ